MYQAKLLSCTRKKRKEEILAYVTLRLVSWFLRSILSAFSTAASSCVSDGSRANKGSGTHDAMLQSTKRSAKTRKLSAVISGVVSEMELNLHEPQECSEYCGPEEHFLKGDIL